MNQQLTDTLSLATFIGKFIRSDPDQSRRCCAPAVDPDPDPVPSLCRARAAVGVKYWVCRVLHVVCNVCIFCNSFIDMCYLLHGCLIGVRCDASALDRSPPV